MLRVQEPGARSRRRRVGCRKKAREILRFKSELKEYREEIISEVRLHPFSGELLAIK